MKSEFAEAGAHIECNYVVGFLPQVNHDESLSTAVGQKSSPSCVAGDGRAVQSGAQIPMITELGEFRRLF